MFWSQKVVKQTIIQSWNALLNSERENTTILKVCNFPSFVLITILVISSAHLLWFAKRSCQLITAIYIIEDKGKMNVCNIIYDEGQHHVASVMSVCQNWNSWQEFQFFLFLLQPFCSSFFLRWPLWICNHWFIVGSSPQLYYRATHPLCSKL